MFILEALMWTPEDRVLVGDFGSGQALSDDQYRLIEPFIPPPEPVRHDTDTTRHDVVSPDLARLLKALVERIEADHVRLIKERDAARAEGQEVQAEADHAKADQVRMAQDVAGMFDELRALVEKHAELHADRARLEAELERARQDADRQRADHADLEQVRDELDRARQDAGLWREEADRERARTANLQADAEHTERELARLRAELEQARRPWCWGGDNDARLDRAPAGGPRRAVRHDHA